MAGPIVIVGSPTALGGHFGGMEQTPGELRKLGAGGRPAGEAGPGRRNVARHGRRREQARLGARPRPAGEEPRIDRAYLPRLAGHVATALGDVPSDARLLAIGGDCTTHAGAMAGIRRARPGVRLGLAWFDAHGDFNTPDTTPSGNVWGMPFAMICGRGDADLVAACEGPSVREENAALLGGQVLDETESRMLAASRVAHFGAGMLGTDGGQAALAAWARTVAARVDGFYVALRPRRARCVRRLGGGHARTRRAVARHRDVVDPGDRGRAGPVVGFGATAVLIGRGGDPHAGRWSAVASRWPRPALGAGRPRLRPSGLLVEQAELGRDAR